MARAESRGSMSLEERSGVSMSEQDTRKLQMAGEEGVEGTGTENLTLSSA